MTEALQIDTDYIELAQVMKLVNWVGTGGEAKLAIQYGEVSVNGEVETRRGKKLYPGDVISYENESVTITAQS